MKHRLTSKTKWFAILNKIDIQSDKNSYYKIQLLESDNHKKYYIFRSWGRIGTTIGGNKTENYSSSSEAIEAFKQIYLDRTGNHFGAKALDVIIPLKTLVYVDVVKRARSSFRRSSKMILTGLGTPNKTSTEETLLTFLLNVKLKVNE